ncbi:MAG: glycoside hydrolase family 97 N-terminal domain-containing protein [Deltaproteobacteria bacterium]|nr:glycoside hydrolase family 97 N-terminal domain-containing protein [Deltaproteobacteria bacterium]
MGKNSWVGRVVLFLACLAAFGCDSSSSVVTVAGVLVASPSGDVRMAVATDAEGRMTYTVTRGDIIVVESSPLGLSATTHDLTTGVTMSSSSGRAIDESYTMLVGKRRDRQAVGNEITVPLRDVNGARAELIMRAHEDGVAFRYHLLGGGMAHARSFGRMTAGISPSSSLRVHTNNPRKSCLSAPRQT